MKSRSGPRTRLRRDMELSRQGRPWKGEVPRNCGPVDPVENQPRIAREKGEDRAAGREALGK